jgi:hypothetical protein
VWQAAAYYGTDGVASSPARSVWAVTWSEVPGELAPADRAILAETGRRLVASRQFGERVRLERWARGE